MWPASICKLIGTKESVSTRKEFNSHRICLEHQQDRLRVVPRLSSGIVERAKRERAWKPPHAAGKEKNEGLQTKPKLLNLCVALTTQNFLSPHRVSPCSRGVIFTRTCVSLALLSLRKNGGLLVVYQQGRRSIVLEHQKGCRVVMWKRPDFDHWLDEFTPKHSGIHQR